MRIVNGAIVCALAALALAAPAALADEVDEAREFADRAVEHVGPAGALQVATASKAVVARGYTAYSHYDQSSLLLDRTGKYILFDAVFTDPQGEVVGTEPTEAQLVDAREPFAILRVERHHLRPDGWPEKFSFESCYVVQQPVRFGEEGPGTVSGSLSEVWFDVSGCDDGLGYEHYRVRFHEDTEMPLRTLDAPSYWDVADYWFSPFQHGTLRAFRHTSREYALLEVCGYDGSGYDCYREPKPGYRSYIWPQLSNAEIHVSPVDD